MKITITLQADNAAFEGQEGAEVARILRVLASRVEGYTYLTEVDVFSLMDIDGNRVGSMDVEPDA